MNQLLYKAQARWLGQGPGRIAWAILRPGPRYCLKGE